MKVPLILLSGEGVDRILMKDVLLLLNKYFEVHYIEIPGFIDSVPPLQDLSYKELVKYFQNEIDFVGKNKKYILGSVSLGYLFLPGLKVNKNCVGYLPIFPCAGRDALDANFFIKYVGLYSIKLLEFLKLQDWVWNTTFFQKYLLYSVSSTQLKIVDKEIDHKTWFFLAKMVLGIKKQILSSDLPIYYVVGVKDGVLKGQYLKDNLNKNNKPNIKISMVNISHLPKNFTTSKLSSVINRKFSEEVISFFKLKTKP